MTPTTITGDYVADLHKLAHEHYCEWANVHGLPVPYWADPDARTVYVDGRLTAQSYYLAVAEGLAELIGAATHATVTHLHRDRARHRNTG